MPLSRAVSHADARLALRTILYIKILKDALKSILRAFTVKKFFRIKAEISDA
ncbi:MAG: hypothetical protein IJT73_02220 [Selenomonadaceae bacterium]|nr:hypothetical protein [Selenomonadaceae bacterium]